MKIIILDHGTQLTNIDVDIESLLAQSEKEKGVDPVRGTLEKLVKVIGQENILIEGGEIKKLHSIIANLVVTGDFDDSVKLQGSNMNNPKTSKKADDAENPKLEQARKVFEGVISYPNTGSETTYDGLIGLDDIKSRLIKEASLLLSSDSLENWSRKYHKQVLVACKAFEKRTPLIVFAGDVGTGKTALAESFGNQIAKQLKLNVYLLRVSVQTRGTGLVGEMTQLINKAFKEAVRTADSLSSPVILLIDEADTLAQSREETQMHHEDKAGVNALIQGIDHIRDAKFHILIVFCTNRMNAIDPAIVRRAAIIHQFVRPNYDRLENLFRHYFEDMLLTNEQFSTLANAALQNDSRAYGFTYSDIINRVIPTAVLKAYPDRALDFLDIIETIQSVEPTPPFQDEKRL